MDIWSVVGTLLLVLFVILIIREINCWYWKINKIVANQEEIIYLMKRELKRKKDSGVDLEKS